MHSPPLTAYLYMFANLCVLPKEHPLMCLTNTRHVIDGDCSKPPLITRCLHKIHSCQFPPGPIIVADSQFAQTAIPKSE